MPPAFRNNANSASSCSSEVHQSGVVCIEGVLCIMNVNQEMLNEIIQVLKDKSARV